MPLTVDNLNGRRAGD